MSTEGLTGYINTPVNIHAEAWVFGGRGERRGNKWRERIEMVKNGGRGGKHARGRESKGKRIVERGGEYSPSFFLSSSLLLPCVSL